MRIIKKIGILLVALWVILVVFGNNTASIRDAIREVVVALMPIVIVIGGIGLMIRSIFK